MDYDFYDFLSAGNILEDPEKFDNLIKNKIKCGGNELNIRTPDDLIPYFTHKIIDLEGDTLFLSPLSTLELTEKEIYPTQAIRNKIVEFDKFVKDAGKTPIWDIPVEERLKWKPCPLGDVFFCEPELELIAGERRDTICCPFMYANRRFPCIKAKAKERGEELI